MLTELDNCILGIIWRAGPMSAYDVRSHLGSSTTVAWSSSTGTVYPSIKRLIAAKLIEAGPCSGPRRRRPLRLTRKGLASLRQWLLDVRQELGSSGMDPLRTRVQFIAALDSNSRQRAFDAYRDATRSQIETLKRHASQPVSNFAERCEMLGIRGALGELCARLAWLNDIEAEVIELRSG